MARSTPGMHLAIAAAMFGAGMNAASPAQPASASASEAGPPAGPLAEHPYKSAFGAVWNYESCGACARPAAVIEVQAALRSVEAAAEAKGLGPTLERLRLEYRQLLSVSTMAACGGGPRAALANARRALEAFRTWVADQPGRP